MTQYVILAAAIFGIWLLRADAYDQGYKAGWKTLAAVIDKTIEEGQ